MNLRHSQLLSCISTYILTSIIEELLVIHAGLLIQQKWTCNFYCDEKCNWTRCHEKCVQMVPFKINACVHQDCRCTLTLVLDKWHGAILPGHCFLDIVLVLKFAIITQCSLQGHHSVLGAAAKDDGLVLLMFVQWV